MAAEVTWGPTDRAVAAGLLRVVTLLVLDVMTRLTGPAMLAG